MNEEEQRTIKKIITALSELSENGSGESLSVLYDEIPKLSKIVYNLCPPQLRLKAIQSENILIDLVRARLAINATQADNFWGSFLFGKGE